MIAEASSSGGTASWVSVVWAGFYVATLVLFVWLLVSVLADRYRR